MTSSSHTCLRPCFGRKHLKGEPVGLRQQTQKEVSFLFTDLTERIQTQKQQTLCVRYDRFLIENNYRRISQQTKHVINNLASGKNM